MRSTGSSTLVAPVPDDDREALGNLGSVFGQTEVQGNSNPPQSLNLAELRARKIRYPGRGRRATATISMFQKFFAIGTEFYGEARSFNDVAVALEKRPDRDDFPCSASSVRRICQDVEMYFESHFDTREPLFRVGKGRAVIGLTKLGDVAWELTREYLVNLGLIEEKS